MIDRDMLLLFLSNGLGGHCHMMAQDVSTHGDEAGQPASPQSKRVWMSVGIVLWCLAVIGMIALSFFVHVHRQPLPFELSFSRWLQASITVSWIGSGFRLLTAINDPVPD